MPERENPETADQLSFEQAIEQLEQTVDRIECGEVGLEECLSQYERGMKLVQRCQTILSKAQQRVAELTADAEGKLRTSDDDSADRAEPRP